MSVGINVSRYQCQYISMSVHINVGICYSIKSRELQPSYGGSKILYVQKLSNTLRRESVSNEILPYFQYEML